MVGATVCYHSAAMVTTIAVTMMNKRFEELVGAWEQNHH